MAGGGLSSGTDFLRDAAKTFFDGIYHNPPTAVSGTLDNSISWAPSLQVKVNDHLTVIAEASETPYPAIFGMRRVDIERLQMPISIYCVCPEEVFLGDQAEIKRLINDGYGLLTVDALGNVQERSSCIPVIQQIPDSHFKEEIKSLPLKLKRRLAESFIRYNQSAPMGVSDISEVIEGLVLKAGAEAARKGWITNQQAKTPAGALGAMITHPSCNNAMAAIGAAQGFITLNRNTSHHFPKNKKQAAKKYRDCRHAFLEGVKKAELFRNAMKNIGLSGNLPG